MTNKEALAELDRRAGEMRTGGRVFQIMVAQPLWEAVAHGDLVGRKFKVESKYRDPEEKQFKTVNPVRVAWYVVLASQRG